MDTEALPAGADTHLRLRIPPRRFDKRSCGSRLFFIGVLVVSAGAVRAEGWVAEAYGGDAFNLRSRLSIEQDGGFSRSLSADYETRAFRAPPYYMLRTGRWRGEAAWEVALIHHKLYLKNPPAGVASLSVSHGFNMVTLNRAIASGDWVYRFGAGPVITHAEATINGTVYNGPYRLAGVAVLAGAGRRFSLGERMFVALEGAVSAGYAKPRMSGPPDAELRVTNLALHGFVGLGYRF